MNFILNILSLCSGSETPNNKKEKKIVLDPKNKQIPNETNNNVKLLPTDLHQDNPNPNVSLDPHA